MIINFPKKIRYSKDNPLVDFYRKCLKSINSDLCLDKIKVTAFTINSKDYKKLKKALGKYFKINYPFLGTLQIEFQISMTMLDFGPRVSPSLEEGRILIDENFLYENIREYNTLK